MIFFLKLLGLCALVALVQSRRCPSEKKIEKRVTEGALIDYVNKTSLTVGDGVYCEVVNIENAEGVCGNDGDDTNTTTTSGQKHLHTKNSWSYDYGYWEIPANGVFHFRVKQTSHAFIGLFPGKVETDKFEIILDRGAFSVIEYNALVKDSVNKKYLNKDEFRGFWVKVDNKNKRMEIGREGEKEAFLMSEIGAELKFFSFKTHWYPGEWIFNESSETTTSVLQNIKKSAKVKCWKQVRLSDTCGLAAVRLQINAYNRLKVDAAELKNMHKKVELERLLESTKHSYGRAKKILSKASVEAVESGIKCTKQNDYHKLIRKQAIDNMNTINKKLAEINSTA